MSESGRIMALDIGDVRIGVAVSDPMRIICSPHSVVKAPSREAALAEICRLVETTESVLVVAGIPIDSDGRQGPQAKRTITFVERLRTMLKVEVVLQDERYSTAAAERMLIGADVRRDKRRQVVDKIAATHILQTYLDRQAAQERTRE